MTCRLRFMAAVAAVLVLALAAFAQTPATPATPAANAALPAFAVVSIKPFRPKGPWHRMAQFDPQRLYIEGMAPVELINLAYSLNGNQLVGLPEWGQYSLDHLFSVTGITKSPATRPQMLLMLRRVLAERFQLVVATTNQVQPVYFLQIAPGGPKLAPIKPGEDCQAALQALPRPEGQVEIPFAACTIPDLVTRLNTFATWLVPLPVIDKTGLEGSYAMRVQLQMSDVKPIMVNGRRGEKVGHLESVAEALQSEFGLELVKAQAPYPKLKVVHIASPGPDQ